MYKPGRNWASTTPTDYYIYYVQPCALLSTLRHYSVMKRGKFITPPLGLRLCDISVRFPR